LCFSASLLVSITSSEFNIVDPTLFNGSDMLTKIDRSFTDTSEEFGLDAIPVATSNPYRYQQVLNPGLLGASPSLNR